jgi:hypothetical protein
MNVCMDGWMDGWKDGSTVAQGGTALGVDGLLRETVSGGDGVWVDDHTPFLL